MIDVQELQFAYDRRVPILKGLSFHVSPGEIFGVLGPSGAGKSTLQKILIGLLPKYRGTAMVMGQHCDSVKGSFFSRVGVDFETPTLFERFTAMENLSFFTALYSRPCFAAEDLLNRLGLAQAANMRVSAFSKGMKSRLNFARAILNNPDLIFLDEPTNGLDPASAAAMKEIIKGLRQQSKTIVLTTHNMQDATELCDRVAFLMDGQLKALDTPHNLIMAKGATTLAYTFTDDGREQRRTVPLQKTAEDGTLAYLIQSNRLTSLHTNEPTLADVFTQLTGGRLDA